MTAWERRGIGAIVVTLLSAGIGVAYFAYLRMAPFPPTSVRIVALIWLARALVGFILGASAMARRVRLSFAFASILLSVPNIILAAIFALAAIMGDNPAPPTSPT